MAQVYITHDSYISYLVFEWNTNRISSLTIIIYRKTFKCLYII